MTPHLVEFGERYGDDSGWERRVAVNTATGNFEIELQASSLSGSTSELQWLIEALNKAIEIVQASARGKA